MSVEEIGAAICSHLKTHDISVVLSGGACVSIYSGNQYESNDLDFVMSDYSFKEIDPLMEKLGFKRTMDQRHYEHPQCFYFIEFPPSPLTVGEEFVKKTVTLKNRYGRLVLLRPVDSVKDRLAAFYHWNDRQSLEQAVMICLKRRVSLKEIEHWSRNERMQEKFKLFLKIYKERKIHKF